MIYQRRNEMDILALIFIYGLLFAMAWKRGEFDFSEEVHDVHTI
jgi:hypothetical protein